MIATPEGTPTMNESEEFTTAVRILGEAMDKLADLIPDGDTDDEDNPLALAWRAVDGVQTDLLGMAADASALERLRERGEI